MHGPKVLIFSTVDIQYLSDSVERWGKEIGVNGFLLSYVADWWTQRAELFRNLDLMREVNRRGAACGVDSNFINVALGYKELPLWTDDKAWAGVLQNFRGIAEFIRQSGTRGIAIDTEPYNAALFNSRAARFKDIDREILRARVYQRGREIMRALTEVYPEIEVIILPEGALYWFNPEGGISHDYELWIDFFDGAASVRNRRGIVIAGERTYSVPDKSSMEKIYNRTEDSMRGHAGAPQFWNKKCSIALGMWPLGREYNDKSARYSPSDFRMQFSAAVALSPRYVWIYDHGAAWFSLKKEEVEKYTSNGRWIWEKSYQAMPAIKNIDEYYAVLRDYQKRRKTPVENKTN